MKKLMILLVVVVCLTLTSCKYINVMKDPSLKDITLGTYKKECDIPLDDVKTVDYFVPMFFASKGAEDVPVKPEWVSIKNVNFHKVGTYTVVLNNGYRTMSIKVNIKAAPELSADAVVTKEEMIEFNKLNSLDNLWNEYIDVVMIDRYLEDQLYIFDFVNSHENIIISQNLLEQSDYLVTFGYMVKYYRECLGEKSKLPSRTVKTTIGDKEYQLPYLYVKKAHEDNKETDFRWRTYNEDYDVQFKVLPKVTDATTYDEFKTQFEKYIVENDCDGSRCKALRAITNNIGKDTGYVYGNVDVDKFLALMGYTFPTEE